MVKDKVDDMTRLIIAIDGIGICIHRASNFCPVRRRLDLSDITLI